MSDSRPWWLPLAAWAGQGLVRLLGATWRFEVVRAPEYAEAERAGERFVYAFWHSVILPMAVLRRDELHRIEHAVGQVAARILPNGSVPEVIELLETDPKRAIEGEDNLRAWLQDLMDTTIAEMNGVHFDIPGPVRRVEAMLAPPGGGASMYYTPPSEDFSRPGRTWYPTEGLTRFPIWGEVSTCYHEGVPGHHFQLAIQQEQKDLPRFRARRTFGGISAHSEGWALYVERLAVEEGWYEGDPAGLLGALGSELFRARRLVVDTGLHTKRWTRQQAIDYGIPASEVERYIANPGQACSYMVGMLRILELREEAKAKLGAKFSLPDFHDVILRTGTVPLDLLGEVVNEWVASQAKRKAG